ncbi:AI-2E family transporter [Thiohalorhabdus sp. Cl-TMA]|uniref:AI-2E family transporter n=1 Tax=Thiohalorhabdus methylotrophus TaxID=3242694 RepID=A0ABV4TSM3_9GAMM
MNTLLHRYPQLRVLGLFGLLLGLAGVLAFLLRPLLVPLVLAVILYAVLEPFTSLLERRGFKRTPAALLVLVLLLAISGLAAAWLFPHLAAQVELLQGNLPTLWQTLSQLAQRVSEHLASATGVHLDVSAATADLAQGGQERLTRALVQGSNLLLDATATLLLVPLLTFFLIRDWKLLRNRLLDLLPNRSFELGWTLYYRVARQLQAYIRGVMLQSGIMALITGSGFFLIGLGSPVLLGLLAGVLNLIPYLGPVLAMIPPTVLILGDSGLDPWVIGSAVGVVFFGQVFDNAVVVPGVLAHAVNLHPLMVVLGIIMAGHFFGLAGMILALPALATGKIVLHGLREGLPAA